MPLRLFTLHYTRGASQVPITQDSQVRTTTCLGYSTLQLLFIDEMEKEREEEEENFFSRPISYFSFC